MTTHPGVPNAAINQALEGTATTVIPFTPWRWALASVGVLFVALGAVGVVVPGLPTTIFLILASWSFAKSCPWLEAKLIRNRFFRPFLVYLEPGVKMPMKAKVISIGLMWFFIAGSCGAFLARGDWIIALPVIAAGAVGTWFIARR